MSPERAVRGVQRVFTFSEFTSANSLNFLFSFWVFHDESRA
jgi:hypothetical protein